MTACRYARDNLPMTWIDSHCHLDAPEFAADRDAAAAAGFDDAAFHALFDASPDAAWPMRREHHPTSSSGEPFDAWRANADRLAY